MPDVTPYSTATPLLGKLPDYIEDQLEKERVAAYALYESMYWNVPGTFSIQQRGSNADPIYVPAARQIVETFNRFLAPGLTINVDPTLGTPNDQLLAMQVWDAFATREKFYSKFNTGKRYGLIRGDWAWHIWADPEREEGSKVSIYQIDPASLFPIYDVNNIDDIIGWNIIETVLDNDGKPYISRMQYLKETLKGGPSPITYAKALYEVDDWGGPGAEEQSPKPVQVIQAPVTLPSPIDALPIYVVQNFDEPGALWGSSELRGMERLIAGLHQTISDEDLTLALEGIGVYATDAGTPVDEDGEDVAWNMGPGRVIELPDGKKFVRVTGAGSFAPFQEHLAYLHSQIDTTFGMGAVAKGSVDVSTAESGVALLLELGPLLARGEEREVLIKDVHQQLLYGIGKWFSAFEGTQFNSLWEVTKWTMKFGPKVPRNQDKDFDQAMTLAGSDPQIVPMSYIRDRLRTLGFDDMPDEATILTELTTEQTAKAAIEQDAVGSRMDSEADEFLGT